MATFAATDYNILVNGVNMSAMCKEATLDLEADALDSTAFGSSWRSKQGGLKAGNFGLTFNQDFAAAQVDALLWPLFGTVVSFEIRPTSAARSATNPGYTGSVLVNAYSPFSNAVGDLAESKISWPTSGLVQRQTA